MKYLVLKGTSGLGNRLGALCTAMALARKTGRTLVVDWNDWFYSPDRRDVFRRLFAAPATPPVESIPSELAVAPAIWSGSLGRSLDWMIDRHAIPYGDEALRRLSIDAASDPDEPVAVYFGYWFNDDPRGLLAEVRPAERIVRRVDDFVRAHLGATTIGVHVRQSDNMSQPYLGRGHGVSVAAIEEALAARLAADPGATIFLATDNRAVLDHFRARYPRLVSLPKWYPPLAGDRMHGNPQAPDPLTSAEDALTDMLLLARCRRLVYSSRATFGRYAAAFSGLAPEDVTDIAGAPAEPDDRFVERPSAWARARGRMVWHLRHRARRLLYGLASLWGRARIRRVQ